MTPMTTIDLAIPQDFLPLESVDITDVWPNTFSRQIQKKLMAARLVRHDSRLRAVVVTYFACGPDSFGNPFFTIAHSFAWLRTTRMARWPSSRAVLGSE